MENKEEFAFYYKSNEKWKRAYFDIDKTQREDCYEKLICNLVDKFKEPNESEIASVWSVFFKKEFKQKTDENTFSHKMYNMEVSNAVNNLGVKIENGKEYDSTKLPNVIHMLFDTSCMPDRIKNCINNSQLMNRDIKDIADPDIFFDEPKMDAWKINKILGDKNNKEFIDAFLKWIGQDVLRLDKNTIDTIMEKSGYNAWKEEKEGSENSDCKSRRYGQNLIIYGAPGTGKSYWVENYKNTIDWLKIDTKKITRVVFHSEYTYFDFVGQYRPYPVYKKANKNDDGWVDISESAESIPGQPYIDYRFVPGPFTKTLVKALNDPVNTYTLLIEELNRADAAAVFGDVFQLLDRKNGRSEYPIEPSKEWLNYLKKVLVNKDIIDNSVEDGVFIPSNMNIIATMNSADQGVHLLDTAFKRRWRYKYISVKAAIKEAGKKNVKIKYAGKDVSWLSFIEEINNKLSDKFDVPEDRWIGPYFATEQELESSDGEAAIEKVLFYLWDDVLRNTERRNDFFEDSPQSLGDLIYLESDVKRYQEETVIKDLAINDSNENNQDDPGEQG